MEGASTLKELSTAPGEQVFSEGSDPHGSRNLKGKERRDDCVLQLGVGWRATESLCLNIRKKIHRVDCTHGVCGLQQLGQTKLEGDKATPWLAQWQG